MSKIISLLHVSEKERFIVCEELGVSLEEFENLSTMLKAFVSKSVHLPKDYDTAMITGALINNKLNFQAAKNLIENYFRCKNLYADPLFNNCVPGSKKYLESKKFTINLCTKKLTKEGFRVQYVKLTDPDGKAENVFIYLIMLVMMCEVRGVFDFWSSTIVIADLEEVTYKNIFKISTQFAVAVKDILESIHFRVQMIHIVNGPSIVEKCLDLARLILPRKLKDRLMVHKNNESLHEWVPKECLPNDFGGTDRSIKELRDDWNKAFDELQPFFQNLRNAKSSKKYEFSKKQKRGLGLGVEGTFRKLNID